MIDSQRFVSFRRDSADILRSVVRSRSAQVFALVWLLAAVYLIAVGRPNWVITSLAVFVPILLFALITTAITDPPGRLERDALPRPRGLVWAQVLVVGLLIALTAYNGLVFHGIFPAEPGIPVWTPFIRALERLGGQWFGLDNALANPVTYFLIPLPLLLLLGARLPDLGLGRGHRVGRVTLLWCGLPLLILLVLLLTGQATAGRIGGRLLSNAVQNGFFEEFLFRGALQTRLRRWLTPGWALVIQALIFGVWHLGLGFTNTGSSNVLAALASTIVFQAALGVAFGIILERSRSLVAGSLFHIIYNTVGSL